MKAAEGLQRIKPFTLWESLYFRHEVKATCPREHRPHATLHVASHDPVTGVSPVPSDSPELTFSWNSSY